MLTNDTIVSSDNCGYIAQYHLIERRLLDYVMHPDTSGEGTVMLTQFFNSNYGGSGKKGDSTLYLYKTDQNYGLEK